MGGSFAPTLLARGRIWQGKDLTMRRIYLAWAGCVGLMVSLAGCASAGPPDLPAAAATGAAAQPLITYCDLIASPRKYLGKEVRVVGIYRVGFEWQQMYSTRCLDGYTTWVEWHGGTCADLLPPEKPATGPSKAASKQTDGDLPALSESTMGMIARGILTGGDGFGYGHLNSYTFQFDLSCVEHLEVLDDRSYHPSSLTGGMKRKYEKFLARTDPAKVKPPQANPPPP